LHNIRKEEFLVRIRKVSMLILTLILAISFSIPAFATGYGPGTVTDETPFVPEIPTGTEPTTPVEPAVPPTPPTPERPAPVTSTQVMQVVQNALADLAATLTSTRGSGETPSAVAVLENVSRIAASTIKTAFRAATRANAENDFAIELDSVTEDGEVLSMVTINAEIAAKLKGSVDFTVKLEGREVDKAVRTVERYFSNEFAVVSLGQKGAFGADVPMAVKVDTARLNTNSLHFYAFRQNSTKYTELDTDYKVEGGFLHFTTPVGGNIVITDKPLSRR
jgi:hypothetical protein